MKKFDEIAANFQIQRSDATAAPVMSGSDWSVDSPNCFRRSLYHPGGSPLFPTAFHCHLWHSVRTLHPEWCHSRSEMSQPEVSIVLS